jgi:hypothetical protein
MKDSVFGGLPPAQLTYLKSQYLASLQMLDQSEASLKAQLEAVSQARAQLLKHLKELDQHLEGPARPGAGSRARPARTPTRRASGGATRARRSTA